MRLGEFIIKLIPYLNPISTCKGINYTLLAIGYNVMCIIWFPILPITLLALEQLKEGSNTTLQMDG